MVPSFFTSLRNLLDLNRSSQSSEVGDIITCDVQQRLLKLEVSDDQIQRRVSDRMSELKSRQEVVLGLSDQHQGEDIEVYIDAESTKSMRALASTS